MSTLLLVLVHHYGNDWAWYAAIFLCCALGVMCWCASVVEMPFDIFSEYRKAPDDAPVPTPLGKENQ